MINPLQQTQQTISFQLGRDNTGNTMFTLIFPFCKFQCILPFELGHKLYKALGTHLGIEEKSGIVDLNGEKV